jgi:hypothetical protein
MILGMRQQASGGSDYGSDRGADHNSHWSLSMTKLNLKLLLFLTPNAAGLMCFTLFAGMAMAHLTKPDYPSTT